MSTSKFSVKYCVLLPIVLAVTIFLWAVPVSFFGIDALTVVQQRMIAIFIFAALMWMFEIIPNWTTSLIVIVVMLLTVSDKGMRAFCDPQYGTLIDYKSIMASFADPVVMLFLGGFVFCHRGFQVRHGRQARKGSPGPFRKEPQIRAARLPSGDQPVLDVHEQHRHRRHDAGLPGPRAQGASGQ